jgi:hypothetical protein
MDEHLAAAHKIIDDSKRELKEMQDRTTRDLERVENLSIQNFASWRDYLHKYFSIIFLLIGATGFLQNESFHFFYFKLGLWLALAGVFLGYITINIYFYIERRWFQGSHLMSVDGIYKQFKHPEMNTDDFAESLLLHNKDFISELRKKLEIARQEKNSKQVAYLKRMIKRNKKMASSFYFIGQHFELVEKIWIIGVSFSIALTILGTFLMFANIVDNKNEYKSIKVINDHFYRSSEVLNN